MTTNKSQYTLTTQWIVPEDKNSEVENFFAEHEVWMRETHNLSGNDEPRIVDYSVSRHLTTLIMTQKKGLQEKQFILCMKFM